jgi:hypothetical protein
MDNRADELIHEVEEQLRWEKLEKIGKDYGAYIIGAIVAVILGVAGYVYWNHAQLKHQEALSETYTDALQLMGKGQTKEAMDLLKTIENDASGYGMLAQFVNAAGLVDNPETRPQAIAIYKKMLENRTIDRHYRSLATIFLVMADLDTGDPKEMKKMLEDASISTNMWPDSTAELTALVNIRLGEVEKAKEILQDLKDSKTASQGIRLRANALLQTLQQSK